MARAAGEVENQPRIDRAEAQLAALGTLAGTRNLVEDPPHFARREVARERQAGDLSEPFGAVGLACCRVCFCGERVDDRLHAGILPDDGVGDGLASLRIPDHGRLALVGDANARDSLAAEPGLAERLAQQRLGRLPDLGRIVPDPAGLLEDLPVLALRIRNLARLAIEHDHAGARGALINSDDVVCGVLRCHIASLPAPRGLCGAG